MTIVYLHGWGQSRETFQAVANKLESQHKVIALDLPGFGSEPPPDSAWGIEEYANFIIKKVKNKKDVVLIGHSFGGRISALIASKNPSWLKAAVLYAAPAIYRPSDLLKLKISLYKTFKFLVPKRYRRIFYSQDHKGIHNKIMSRVFRKAVVTDLTSELKQIKIPTLILWGQKDLVVSYKLGVEMSKLIKGSDLEIVPNADHNFHLKKPDLFYGLINKFISGLS